MEFLNAQTKYVADQLRSLSASQRVAIGLLLVILLGGMWGMIQWSGQGEWIDLLGQSLTPQELNKVETQLRLAGIESKVDGDRIFIHGDEGQRQRVHAMLAQSKTLPGDMTLGYAELVNEDNVWESDQKSRWKQQRALESELSAVIAGFTGITDARVLIQVSEGRRIGRRSATSSASVMLVSATDEPVNQQQVDAIARYIAGAVSGLDAKEVTLTDGSRSYRASDASEGLAKDMLGRQRQLEDHYRRMIYDQLKHIEGVVINVRAILRQDDEQTAEITWGKAVTNRIMDKEEETKGGSTAAGPGVRPNQSRALTDATQGSSTLVTETEETLEGDRDRKNVQIVKSAGALLGLTASVNVPSSYLLGILGAQDPQSADTSRAGIQKVADAELPKIEAQVKTLILAAGEGDNRRVVVDWYYASSARGPATATPAEAVAVAASSPLEVVPLLKQYGPQAGLGLLAAFSLLMVLRIAKKAQGAIVQQGASAKAAAKAAALEEPQLDSLSAGIAPIGEVQEMEGILVGHEVDEGTVRTQQIVRQIGQMVSEDPASAAGIAAHWLEDEH
jgi:flagellar biosynthesis/type III secretory pathway M-ring protein FliF/YscJ